METVEPRIVLSTVGFLQGTVYADPADTIPLANATVSLYPYQSTTTTPLETVTTDSTGNYAFTGLTPGDYTIVETAPTGYTNDGTSINSPLTTTLSTTASTINVEVYDLSDVSVSFDSNGAFDRDPGDATISLDGTTSLQTYGQIPITISVPNGPTTSEFSSYCVDPTQSLNFSPDTFYAASVTSSSSSQLSNGSAGAISYLYNQYGSVLSATAPTLTPLQALDQQALQIAIWKLEYDYSAGNNGPGSALQSFTEGNFQLVSLYPAGGGVDADPLNLGLTAGLQALETQASTYINQALGYVQNSIVLNPTGAQPAGSQIGFQALLAQESLNFTNNTAASISGEVYNDTNANGQLNDGEVGITGGSVTLTGTNVNGTITPIVEPIAANGTYSLIDLLPGTYSVTETTLPAGYVASGSDVGTVNGTVDGTSTGTTLLSSITVAAGQSAVSENFGVYAPAAISGEVYNDVNGNGVLNNGEVGITGGSVTLTGTNASGAITPIVESISTSGTYSFTGLLPGTYTVTETTLPTGYVASGSDVGSVGGTADGISTSSTVLSSISVTGGQSAVSENFGVYVPAAISGEVYNDANADGLLDNGETGLAGSTVTLTGTTTMGVSVSISEPVAANGTYSFTGLAPGTYALTDSNIPAGYTPVASNVGTVGGTADGTSSSSTVLGGISLAGGQSSINDDFGDILLSCCNVSFFQFQVTTPTGQVSVVPTLTGNVAEGDTVQAFFVIPSGYEQLSLVSYNAPEPYYVAADGADQTIYQSSTGIYGPGVYGLPAITIPNNFYQIDFVCGAPQTNANIYSPTSTTNKLYSAANGGTNPQGSGVLSISGEVYNDANDNDSLDSGESGIGGDTVTLTGTDAYGTAISLTTTTNGSGQYAFTSLPFSNSAGYTVTAAVPTGDFSETANVGTVSGTPDGTAGTEVISKVVLASSTQTTGINYNFPVAVPNNSISGEVYNDANGDGSLDNGESGLAGETVTLTGTTSSGVTITPISKSVASNGTYSFTGLAAGTYTVTESNIPTGYTPVASNVGTVGGTADGTSTSSTVLSGITVAGGQSSINDDFGDILLSCCNVSFFQFQVTTPTGQVSVVPTLTGNVAEGDTVQAFFIIPSGYEQLSLVSYNAPEPYYVAADGADQTIYQSSTGIYGPGVYGLPAITIPNNFYQIDFVCGAPQTNANIYSSTSTTNKLYSAANGGTNPQGSGVLSISGEVYNDSNSNDALDSGETGVAGDTVTLTGTDAYGTAISATTTTNSNGQYSFTGLPFSNSAGYTVTAAVPSGDLGETANVGKVSGATDGTAGTEVVSNIVLASSTQTTGTGYNFGVVAAPLGSISGEVYNDANGDGVLDSGSGSGAYLNGEVGLAGETITLTGTTSTGQSVSVSQQVSSNGTYSFTGLPAGMYVLTESNIPAGFVSTASNPGTINGGVDGVSSSATVISAIGIGSGRYTGINYDFGNVQTSTVSGEVYDDANCDSKLDTGDYGVGGETITLTGTTNSGKSVNISQSVASNGTYSFSGLLPGLYTLTETNIASGYAATVSNPGTINGGLDGVTSSPTVISAIGVGSGRYTGVNYNFGLETDVCSSQVKTCSWWTSCSGESLINCLNGSSCSKSLGSWLAKTCPSTFGCLSGQTNSQISSYLNSLWNNGSCSSYNQACSQLLSTCLNAYVSNSNLAGSAGCGYGFNVTSSGLSTSCFNVGSNGSAMGMSNNCSYNVMNLLTACDSVLGANKSNATVVSCVNNIFGGICGI